MPCEHIIKNTTYENIPKVYIKLFQNIEEVLDILINTSSIELSEYWNQKTTEKKKKPKEGLDLFEKKVYYEEREFY